MNKYSLTSIIKYLLINFDTSAILINRSEMASAIYIHSMKDGSSHEWIFYNIEEERVIDKSSGIDLTKIV